MTVQSNLQTRRNVLKTGAASGLAVLIAGCLGDDGDDDSVENGTDDDDDDEGDWPADGDAINCVIPYAPGGGFGWFGENMSPYVAEYLPNEPNVVNQYIEGGGSIVGTNFTYQEEPDGYTYMLRHGMSSVIAQIATPEEVEFDVREFVDLASPNVSLGGIVQRADLDPIESWDELVDQASELTWGTTGFGDTGHLRPIVLGDLAEAWEIDDLDFVHFEGFGEVAASFDRGEIDVASAGMATALPYIEDGAINPVVTFTHPGETDIVDAPTLTDWDVPNSEQAANAFRTPRIWCAPPGTPDDRAAILEDALVATARDEEFLQIADEAEQDITDVGAEEANQMTEDAFEIWSGQEDLLIEVLGE